MVFSVECSSPGGESSRNFSHLSGLSGSDALSQLVKARRADSYKHCLHVCSVKALRLSKLNTLTFSPLHPAAGDLTTASASETMASHSLRTLHHAATWRSGGVSAAGAVCMCEIAAWKNTSLLLMQEGVHSVTGMLNNSRVI